MPKYKITLADGRTAIVTADSEPSPQEIQDHLDLQDSPAPQSPPEKSLSGFISNLGTSSMNAVKGIAEGVKTLAPVAMTGLKAFGGDMDAMREGAAGAQKLQKAAPQIGASLLEGAKNRYGGLDQIKNTLYNDPLGALMDVATVADGVGAVGKLGGASKVAEVANMVSKATNPVHLAGMAMKPVLREGALGSVLATVRPGPELKEDFGGARNIGKTILDEELTSHASAKPKLDAGKQAVDDALATAEQQGAKGVSTDSLFDAIFGDPTEKAGRRAQLGVQDLRPALEERAQNINKLNPAGEIPLTKANPLKREAQELAYESGKDNLSVNKAADKAIARTFRSEIEKSVPEVGPLNQKEQNLLGASRSLFDAEKRDTNLQHILSLMAGGLLGFNENPLHGLGLAGLGLATNSPALGTRVGIGLNRMGKVAASPVTADTALAMRLAAGAKQ